MNSLGDAAMPVDPATALGTVKTGTEIGIEIGKGAYAGWGWLNKKLYGTVTITHPRNRDPVKPGWVEIEGTHDGKKSIFWLVMPGNEGYWIKSRIELHPDGRWQERIHIGDRPSVTAPARG
jgi:hypothetical protein